MIFAGNFACKGPVNENLQKKESKLITTPDMYRDFVGDLYLQNNFIQIFK
ncbi:hypothetical protein SAMN00777080_3406 [Aquiflexum balticum DSM 16537]|uniref:Uncharacterized protein n=1 Tax=Aquiflexum balticum DSM 16537 TaxID=758820 RepID=A0A1W2H7Y6_9BACT|nr:hypothetical protein SAMN00777080_3406 [Aquiflexum balticum DSM 16537]